MSAADRPSSTDAPTAMRTFGHVLVNTGVANVMTSYLWWALIFWAYLETRSVLVTGVVGGAYMLLTSFSSIAFGSLVDHHHKLAVMRLSSVLTLVAFGAALALYVTLPERTLIDLGQTWFWLFSLIILAGAVVENMRNIALSTTVTILVPDEKRAQANGLVGGSPRTALPPSTARTATAPSTSGVPSASSAARPGSSRSSSSPRSTTSSAGCTWR